MNELAREGLVPASGIRGRYNALVRAGELRPDAEQAAAADALQALQDALSSRAKPGLLGKLFGREPEPVRGVYLWGAVGRGKSMLMDLFADSLSEVPNRRVHFHEFMLEVHERLRVVREGQTERPVKTVATAIAADLTVLAFDEMVVNNAPDAMILSRLFERLWEEGVTVIATSNRSPDDLYLQGLNRPLFLPFIAQLKDHCRILPLNGPTDYRRERLGSTEMWHVPNGPEATAALTNAFIRLTDHAPDDAVPSEELRVSAGRTLHVPKALKGVAVFSFSRLCRDARGAPDYLAIARKYHTVILVGVPKLGPENRNEAARFVTLIDALYEHRVKLLVAADAPVAELYETGDGRFEFDRTVSRLLEMRSDAYLALGHGSGGTA